MNWYLEVLKKYAVFSGRARRTEYWMFALFNLIISFALGFLEGMLGIGSALGISFLALIYSVVTLLPSLAVGARRLHDTGRSGWWMLICLVPILGVLILLYFLVQDSEPGGNQYGQNPKEAAFA